MGILESIVTRPEIPTWYAGLIKPWWTPPPFVFPIAWTILYVMMAVTLWRLWDRVAPSAERGKAIAWFFIQLAINAAWSPVFFGMQSLGGGLAIILLMAIAIVVTIQRFHPLDRTAAWLMAPYLAWVSFASILNVALLALNGKF